MRRVRIDGCGPITLPLFKSRCIVLGNSKVHALCGDSLDRLDTF